MQTKHINLVCFVFNLILDEFYWILFRIFNKETHAFSPVLTHFSLSAAIPNQHAVHGAPNFLKELIQWHKCELTTKRGDENDFQCCQSKCQGETTAFH